MGIKSTTLKQYHPFLCRSSTFLCRSSVKLFKQYHVIKRTTAFYAEVFFAAALALVMNTFVSPDGRVFDVPSDNKSLGDFAIEQRLIKKRSHLSNVKTLLDPPSGKKQLQEWQPLSKLRWLAEINRSTGALISSRDPSLCLGHQSFL